MQESQQILIIDNDPIMRLLAAGTLQTNGFQTLEAASGEDGLKLFTEFGADAILLDCILSGGMDGFTTCAEFRKLPNSEHIPVMMMTGLEDLESIERAFEAGATDFITKPINLALLGHRVRYMLRASHTTQQLAESEKRLHRMAYFDHLTELPNRYFFQEHLQQMIGRMLTEKHKMAVLSLNLDNFKRINDILGHTLGDSVLKAAGKRLHAILNIGEELTLDGKTPEGMSLARLSADEFIILLSPIERREEAAFVAEHILVELAQSLSLEDHEIYTTTSIGIALFPDDGETAEELLKNADLALFHAKREGGNMYRYFSTRMTDAALRRHRVENQLRKSIERDELALYYQPKLDLATGKYGGVEALIRWESQRLGKISPTEFIPLAEESTLIVVIGEWVLRQACRQARAWRNQGIAFAHMAVNVSTLQLLHKDFSSLVAAVLADTGLEPSVLELELTESALISDEDYVQSVLRSLKQIGVQLTIDDFGTGYSSLSRLKNFPIDRLKIDQSFVRDIEQDPEHAAIATAIILMSDSMNMQVTAEGVETEGQLAFLKNKFCNEAQGYLLSKPLPSAQAEQFLLLRN